MMLKKIITVMQVFCFVLFFDILDTVKGYLLLGIPKIKGIAVLICSVHKIPSRGRH